MKFTTMIDILIVTFLIAGLYGLYSELMDSYVLVRINVVSGSDIKLLTNQGFRFKERNGSIVSGYATKRICSRLVDFDFVKMIT